MRQSYVARYPNAVGALVCTLGTASFVINDAFVKLVIDHDASEPMVVTIRNGFAIPMILAVCLCRRDFPKMRSMTRVEDRNLSNDNTCLTTNDTERGTKKKL